MNDALRMQISAFVDGELPENETELLLRRLSQDAALRHQVARCLEIGRLMRREREVPGMSQLRGRIEAALGEDFVEPVQEQKVVGSGLMTPTTGVAVAATVAAVALIGLSQMGTPVDPNLEQAVAIDDGPTTYTQPAIDDVQAERPSELMIQYYLSHGDSAAVGGQDGLRSRAVTWELREHERIETDPDPRLLPADFVKHNTVERDSEQPDNSAATDTP
jgi:hypothetical protein